MTNKQRIQNIVMKRAQSMKDQMASKDPERHIYFAMSIREAIDWDDFRNKYGKTVSALKDEWLYNEAMCYINFLGETSVFSYWGFLLESGDWVIVSYGDGGRVTVAGVLDMPRWEIPDFGRLGWPRPDYV